MLPNLAKRLVYDGYCVVSNIVDDAMLQSLRDRFSDITLSKTSEENFGNSGAFIVADYHNPIIVDVVTWPKTLSTLRSLGFSAPKLHNFYVSTKPPKADALAWHSDLFYRYDHIAPAELFLIYYLGDTSPDNGCLRVVPGSHLWSHEKRHKQPEDARKRADEVSVPVKAGDLFIGDRRILHATYSNKSDVWRTCLTIAYAPVFDELDDSIKSLIIRNRCLPAPGWWNHEDESLDARLKAVLPIYRGHAKPIAVET